MLFNSGVHWLTALLGVSRASAACTNVVIDNFSKWSSNTNSLGSWTSDDGTMTSGSISANGGILTFTPKAGSYFYETFPCQKTKTSGLGAVSFTMQGPAGGSLSLEIQTQTSCSATKYTSQYYTVSGLTGASQTVTIPLANFAGANLDAVTAFVWSGFSKTGTAWKLGNIQLACADAAAPSSSVVVVATSSSKAASSSAPSVTVPPTSSSIVQVATSSTKPTTTVVSVPPSSSPSTLPVATSLQTRIVTTSTTLSSSTVPAAPSSSGCTNLLVDDWESQSRLTFLFYNALLKSSSDDATMKSIVVGTDNRVTLTPKNTDSYFYTSVGCVNTQTSGYGGISLRIKAPAGTTFAVQLQSPTTCGGDDTKLSYHTTKELGWTFDGTEKLYSVPFSKFPEADLTKLSTIFFTAFSKAVVFGPMALYCGSTPSEYVVPPTSVAAGPSSTVPAPVGTAAAMVIDQFSNKDSNALGFWHGGDDGLTLTYSGGKLTIKSSDSDYAFYTQVSGSCADMRSYAGSYVHIAYTGSNKFSVALQQHNVKCNESIAPYPETWDSLEAARYATATDIYMPLSHFNIDQSRVIGLALKGFYSTTATVLTKIEIVPSIPAGFTIPNKLASGSLVFACKRPNSFAFAIDDGDPALAQQVMQTIKSEGIKVTFFTVGAPLEDPSTNLSSVYQDMMSQGHQIALHSYTHPKLEGLPDYASIDWEYNNDISAVSQTFNGLHTPYFRPPFGTEGARMRQRLALAMGTDNPYIVNWSVDVEDWLWAQSSTPEKQLDAFKRDLAAGGNLVVMHYLYPTTVNYLPQFIQLAKATGKQLMRVDQCMMDPNAPPL